MARSTIIHPITERTLAQARAIVAACTTPGLRDLERLRDMAEGDCEAIADESPELRSAVQAEATRELYEDRS